MGNADLTKKDKTTQGGVKIPPGFSSFSSPQDGDVDPQEYAQLLELYDSSFRNLAEGEVVKGTVVKVTPTEVIVDVGFKSEGLIPIEEFIDESGQVMAQPGDMVDVLLERTEDRDGYVVLSREKAEKMKIWDEVEKAFQEKKVVIGRVIERIRGASRSTSASAPSCRDHRSTSGRSATSTR
jgi:small subunit ribosomal protein S1